MESFNIFFEKHEKNPLRKGELKDTGVKSKLSIFKRELTKNLNKPSVKDTYKFLKIRNPEKANEFLKDTETKFKNKFLKQNVSKQNYIKFEISGIEFNIKNDDPVLNTPRFLKIKKDLEYSVPIFLTSIRGLLPLRRPKIILKDIKEKLSYGGSEPPAYYSSTDKIIYIDYYYANNADYLTHEYAHYAADQIPTQSYPMLFNEYKKMLDEYYRRVKKKKVTDLQDTKKINYEREREKIAKYMGWPSPYSVSNPDEFFAEIITHWKNMPNNVATYRFKNSIKQIISRL